MRLFTGLEAFGDATALITDESAHLSYRQVADAADRFGRAVGKRSLVVIACRNSPESVIAYLGALRSGAVPLLVGENVNREFLQGLLDTYRPEFLWQPRTRESDAGRTGSPRYEHGDFVLVPTGYSVDYTLHDELALLLSTSGSTGSPKLVRLSYRNLDSNMRSIAQYLGITSEDRPITTLPMEYSFGLSVINSHLLKGCAIILTGRGLMDRGFWDLMKANEATTFSGVPYTFEMLAKLRFSSMALPSLKVLTQAGGKLGPELSREFAVVCERKGVRFFVMYGQAEASPRISFVPPERAVEKAGSIGIAIPGGELWLEDEDGEVITEADVVGELVFRGDNVCLGYALDRFDLGRGDVNGGVLRTGDVAKRDRDGYYYIVGRTARFLKLFGNRVNLMEMEEMLRSAGYDCACAGDDDRMRIFVANKGSHEAIRRYITERTRIHPAGFVLEQVEEIPRNAAGKVLYHVLART